MITHKYKIIIITATMIFCLLGTVLQLAAQETDEPPEKTSRTNHGKLEMNYTY